MRIRNEAHESLPWHIHEVAADFTLLDVWALPAKGRAEDFETLLEMATALDPSNADSVPARVLWRVRDQLGRWFGWGSISDPVDAGAGGGAGRLPIPGTDETSLLGRVPPELRDTAEAVHYDSLPFVPLYRTDTEFAAEISNATVHGVLHLGWVHQGDGCYQGQMAVYVKPRGALGAAYMALISPFRHRVVYPALMRQFERAWHSRMVQ